MIALLEGEYMRKRELTKKIKELKLIKIQEAELKKRKSEIEKEIKAELEQRGVQLIKVGTYSIRYTEVCKNQLDTDAFKQSYSDLYNQFVTAIRYKRLTIN